MDELKVTGIVLSSADYKENDKMVTIYTLELGVIKAQLKGVKQAKSKLKFACQPFFVGEFFLIKRTFYQVKTVNAIENFFDITQDYDKYLVASIVLDSIRLTQKEGMINEKLFVYTLKIIESLCYDNINQNMLLIKYLLYLLDVSGYQMNFDRCAVCGIKLTNNCSLDIGVGGFVCEICKDQYSHNLEKNVYSSLKIINNSAIDKLSTVKLSNNVLLKCIMLLKLNINNIFKINIASINKMLI